MPNSAVFLRRNDPDQVRRVLSQPKSSGHPQQKSNRMSINLVAYTLDPEIGSRIGAHNRAHNGVHIAAHIGAQNEPTRG